MGETDNNRTCLARPLNTVNSKTISIAITLLVTIFSSGIVEAGVIIEQKITQGAPGALGAVRKSTLMLQDDKVKFELRDRVSVVIDSDDQKVTVIDDGRKTFHELPFRKVVGTSFDPNRLLYTTFNGTDKTRVLAGFKCRDYAGARYNGPLMVATTACFSTDVAGSDDFTHFLKSMARHSRYPKAATSRPPGIPLIIESTRGINPAYVPPHVSTKEAERFKSTIAKIPPQTTRVEVTKITSEKFSPDAFNTPSGYKRVGRERN
jgi:hypothetical protein